MVRLAMKRSSVRLAMADKGFHALNAALLGLVFLIVVLPLLNVLSMSLSSPKAVISGRVFIWPVEFSIDAYRHIAANRDLITGFLNSLLYTSVGTLISVTLTIMAAYPLSRKGIVGARAASGLFVFTMLFSGGMIPTYLLVKSLGMLNTRWALVIPGALSVFNVMIARTFFKTSMPDELYEASELDGASDLRVIFSVVLPLSGPIVAVLCLFYAVDNWNAYFSGFIYLRSKELFPLQVVLRNILASAQAIEESAGIVSLTEASTMEMVEVLKYAIIVFASIPVVAIYPLVQKHFVKGVMIGSLKG
jgi:putative aldouronate transport system permease protein